MSIVWSSRNTPLTSQPAFPFCRQRPAHTLPRHVISLLEGNPRRHSSFTHRPPGRQPQFLAIPGMRGKLIMDPGLRSAWPMDSQQGAPGGWLREPWSAGWGVSPHHPWHLSLQTPVFESGRSRPRSSVSTEEESGLGQPAPCIVICSTANSRQAAASTQSQ